MENGKITIDQSHGMWLVKLDGETMYSTKNGAAAEMYATHIRNSTQPITIGDVKQFKKDSDALDS